MLKIDLHTHVLPEKWEDLEAGTAIRGGSGSSITKPCRARMLIGDRVSARSIRTAGPQRPVFAIATETASHVQVLSTVPVMFSYWAKAPDALDLSRRLNDHVAEMVRSHPRRFAGLGTIPLQDPDLAVGELERCVDELGLAGVQIGSHVNEWDLDREELFPVFERAAELGAAVFVHPWDMLAAERMQRYWLSWLVGMPTETTLAICALIFGGVLARLPKLRVGFAHGGGSFPGTLGRIEHGYNVRPDLFPTPQGQPPSRYLRRIYYDSLVHDAAALRFLIDQVSIERIALGSDYPFPLGEHRPGSLIESLEELSGSQRARLLGGTALELLGLPADRFVG